METGWVLQAVFNQLFQFGIPKIWGRIIDCQRILQLLHRHAYFRHLASTVFGFYHKAICHGPLFGGHNLRPVLNYVNYFGLLKLSTIHAIYFI